MKIAEIKKLTPHQDVNDILALLAQGLTKVFGDQLIGLLLTGSLTYGDFDRGSSDIDFLAVLSKPMSQAQRKQVKDMHDHIGKKYPVWAKRTEGSYITKAMLNSTDLPKAPRPYINSGMCCMNAELR